MSNYDPTESVRREMVAEINAERTSRQKLESAYGTANVWDTAELAVRFEVVGFMAPFATVRDKTTGKKGTVMFCHSPRYYFHFVEDVDTGRW